MKFSITIHFDVPDETTFRVQPEEEPAAPTYIAPFEDQLIPIPDAVPLPGDPVAFRGMAVGDPSGTLCPTHHEPWKLVPAGVSKSSGKPYNAFWGCSGPRGCTQRPSQAFLATHPAA